MIMHPLSTLGSDTDNSGDFSQLKIIDDRASFSGDYPAFYEASGDFGTLGEPPVTSEDMGYLGRRNNQSVQRRRKSRPSWQKPKFTNLRSARSSTASSKSRTVQALTSSGLIARPSSDSSRSRTVQTLRSKGLIASPAAISVLSSSNNTVPSLRMASNTVPSLRMASNTVPSLRMASNTVPVLSPPLKTVPVNRLASNTVPQVVSTGGQLTAQKILASEKRIPVVNKRELNYSYSHPLSKFSSPMSGDNELGDHMQLGFNLSSFLQDAKKRAQEELNKAKQKLQADVKQRVGESLSNLSSQILNKPEVKTVIAEKAKQSVIQNIAEKLNDPEVQKKAAITSIGILAVIGGLAFLAFKRKG
jgi:hypothetical protein